jgi:hypothetical protein
VTSLFLDSVPGTDHWPTEGLGALAVARNGLLIFSQANGHTAEIDLREPAITRRYYLDPPAVRMQLAADGKTLAAALPDGAVQLWEVPDHRLLRTLRAPRGNAMSFSPSGRQLALAAFHGKATTLGLWSVRSGRRLRRLSPPGECATSLAFAAAGNRLVAAGERLVIRDLRTRRRSAHIRLLGGVRCASAAFLADGRQVAAACSDGTVRIWDWRRRRLLLTLHLLPAVTERGTTQEWIALTPDGYYAASEHAARWIRWRQGARLLPAAAYERQFRRPELVRRSLAGGYGSRPEPADGLCQTLGSIPHLGTHRFAVTRRWYLCPGGSGRLRRLERSSCKWPVASYARPPSCPTRGRPSRRSGTSLVR